MNAVICKRSDRPISRPPAKTGRLLALAFLLILANVGHTQLPTSVEAVRLVESPLVELVPITGSVVADRQSSLSPQIAGLVHQLAVDVGDNVQAGDTLLELDDELVRIDREQSKANLLRAEAQWRDSQRRLQEAQALLNGAIAASDIRARAAQEKIQRATLDAAQASLQRLEAEVTRHNVHAPYDGIVSARNVDLGEWVTPGESVIELVALDPVWIHFQVPQRYFAQVTESARVQMQFAPLSEKMFFGTIHSKVPLSQAGARTFLIRVHPPANAPALIPGLATSGALHLESDRSGIMVPRDALIRYPDGRVTVWRISNFAEANSTGTASEVQVDPGISNNGWVEIRSPRLSIGDLVAIRGNEALRENAAVSVERLIDASPNGEVQ